MMPHANIIHLMLVLCNEWMNELWIHINLLFILNEIDVVAAAAAAAITDVVVVVNIDTYIDVNTPCVYVWWLDNLNLELLCYFRIASV